MERIFNQPGTKQFRSKLRRNMPPAELTLWSKLKARQLMGHKFRRQYGIGPYVVDFYCPALKLAIECDGDSHSDETTIRRDQQKETTLKNLGIELMRFRNEEIRNDIIQVMERIADMILRIEGRSRL